MKTIVIPTFLTLQIERPNDNAYIQTTMCMDTKLVVINNLKFGNKKFASKVTYKQSDSWIAELDI